MTNISREAMQAHVDAGRAVPWPQELTMGPDRVVPEAVELDGVWHVVMVGTDFYQEAPELLAERLTSAKKRQKAAQEVVQGKPTHQDRHDAG
ncbi:hypothetical protein D5S17_35760 [Pseudonocardiaceae bacterium YIM PH 21723]|nr:hypothetical protein D5S17_35760 [Pseudonocardiaceae bacterium YIM PH 21723]